MKEMLKQLSAVTSIATAACFVIGYVYVYAFYAVIGAHSIELLTYSDYLDSLKNAFLLALVFAVVYGTILVSMAQSRLDRIKAYLVAFVRQDGAIPKPQRISTSIAAQIVLAASFVIMVAGTVWLFARTPGPPDFWSLTIVYIWLAGNLAMFFSVMILLIEGWSSRWGRLMSAGVIGFGVTLTVFYYVGGADARAALAAGAPNAELLLADGKTADCVVVSIVGKGYFVEMPGVSGAVFLPSDKVSRIRFLPNGE